MTIFCNHKLGKVEGNYQYCLKCGKAFPAPKIECSHKWKEKGRYGVYNYGGVNGEILLYECTCCGETKMVKISCR